MKRTAIKICGLTRVQDIQACRTYGADAVGFVFYPASARAVQPEQAGELSQHLGPWQTPVALFVNPSIALVEQVLDCLPNALLQFHGDENAEFCERFRRPYVKAIRMTEQTDLIVQSQNFASASGLLLDSWSKGFGGSGHTFDWSVLPDMSQIKQPFILSGGLNLTNIQPAMAQLKPYGVDLSTGVELQPGIKCPGKIKAFCTAVHEMDAKLIVATNQDLQQSNSL